MDTEYLFKIHYKSHGKPNRPDLKNEKAKCHWCQLRAFSTSKTFPVAIVNDVDSDFIPRDFVLIENCEPGKGIELPDPEFCVGCECTDHDTCKSDECSCLQDMTVLDETDEDKYVYESKGGKDTLRADYLDTREPIYECHDKCYCGENCPNRVVERGRKITLQIFRTEDNRGWGVRSKEYISKGQFVDKYVGEIITAEETERRRQLSDVAQKKDVYLFELDKFKGDADRDPSLADTVFVDGEFRSGPTRFINHSCDPNLRIFARVGPHALKRFHDLAFFAVKDIPAGTELTFDYVDGEDEKLEEEKRDRRKKKEMTKCLCGSDNCRGYLW
ncbi:Histone-lysine N-methyltransferase,H3 lysine-9 specific [Lachnellula hyalina]|uniref:Histone-lysine N-methyltransferase,H3 lysine-9 specific n=1 Tax=Lachnellula hyalina TaxID=1316788 RepID=A0A8H8TY21_9HELO|nr:Histone-lysine N-methyltransferase,H3 lysine-9 specific [Lachnellula hyalina]TVY24457.1 Histone-lysine N-methyltransferase,H3 lysine-9 specific [Lachnellula hyalina]